MNGRVLADVADGVAAQDAATVAQATAGVAGALLKTGGTMSGDINMGTKNITNAGRFTGDVTGNLTGNASTSTTCPSGTSTGTNTGDQDLSGKANLASPTFSGTPSLPTGTTGVTQSAADSSTKLATTLYADTADNLRLPKTGGTMSGAIAMGAQSITGANLLAGATATLTGKVTNYDSLTTVEGGVPSCVKSDSKTAQTANLGATTIYASAPAKRYRISICTKGGVVKTIMVAQSLASFSTANGTIGSGLIDVDASTNIQYSTGGTGGDYASTGTAMQYGLYIVLEAV